MQALVAQPWLGVVEPIIIALLLGLGGRRARGLAPWVAMIGPLLLIAIGAFSLGAIGWAGAGAGPFRSPLASAGKIEWFSVGDVSLRLGWTVDSLAAIMLLVVGLVALCVMVFSLGYMAGERGWVRYYALLSLFTGAMALLVIADSFVTLFIGWELVGACSYLLIGFWYEKPSAAAAATKAFLTTRVGDVGLLLGIAVLFSAMGTLGFAAIAERLGSVPVSTLTLAAVLVAVGAMGKSAQFPLHAWLPDAMEGPTPVSALIHAATMVAAGVYLVVRVWPLFEAAPQARLVLLAAGAVSAFGAALVAVAQRDIKKVLAYSTVSQLGLMFAALGVGAWYAAFFHLVTHAAFKALLFLGSGSVIHGSGTQDLRAMGGLGKPMRSTFVLWAIGVTALAGVPPLAGFFSKDLILESVLHEAPAIGAVLLGASVLTGYYAARSTRLAFFGEPAEGLHAHESPASMVLPMAFLALLALGLGFAGTTLALSLGVEGEELVLTISALAVGAAVIGGVGGWVLSAGVAGDERTQQRLGGVWNVLASAYGWDGFVSRFVVVPVVAGCRVLWAWGDRLIIDGAAEGLGRLAQAGARRVSSLQSGDAQSYATAIAVGVAVMLALSVWLGVR